MLQPCFQNTTEKPAICQQSLRTLPNSPTHITTTVIGSSNASISSACVGVHVFVLRRSFCCCCCDASCCCCWRYYLCCCYRDLLFAAATSTTCFLAAAVVDTLYCASLNLAVLIIFCAAAFAAFAAAEPHHLHDNSIHLFYASSLRPIYSTASARKPHTCLLYTSPSPRDKRQSRMPSSA